MRIDGEWALFDDGVVRPVILGEIRADDGQPDPRSLQSPILNAGSTMPGCLPESSSECVSLFGADFTS